MPQYAVSVRGVTRKFIGHNLYRMQEIWSNLELDEETNTISEVIFAFHTLSNTGSPSSGKFRKVS